MLERVDNSYATYVVNNNIILIKGNKMKYTIANTKALRSELKASIANITNVMYEGINLTEQLTRGITTSRVARINLLANNPMLSELNVYVSEQEFKTNIAHLSEDVRKVAWRYRAYEIRQTLLLNILGNSKKLSYLVDATLRAIVTARIEAGGKPTSIGEIVHNVPLNASTYKTKDGTEYPLTPFGVDELRLQLISELAEADLIDIKVSGSTHTIEIPIIHTNKVSKECFIEAHNIYNIISRKTILVQPAPIDINNMISRSSWWYKTPTLSNDQIEFIETMHNLKWEFIPEAEDKIEDAFKMHLDVIKLPDWAISRVEEFKAQIQASKANGGHYVAGKFDSALRWYYQAEIGHNQTSKYLRDLVRPVGMVNQVKYDMTNNVVQMYSIGLKDKGLGRYVNLVNSAECQEDVRSQIANAMNKNLNLNTFSKDNVKPLFMVWAYNAGRDRLLNGVYTEETSVFTGIKTRVPKVKGLKELAQGIDEDLVWNTWSAVLNKLVPTIVELKKVMANIIKGNPFHEMEWTLPDGAIAQYASVQEVSKELHWVTSGGKTLQHTHHRKELAYKAKDAGVLPRVIHSIDAYMMRQLVIRGNKLGITIAPNHDSFMFSEIHTDTVFNMVRELFIELLENNTLANIVSQLNKTKVKETGKFLERETLTKEDILASMPMALED